MFVDDRIVPCGIERLHRDRLLLMCGAATDLRLECLPVELSIYMGKWLVLMCCDVTDDHLCVSRPVACGVERLHVSNRMVFHLRRCHVMSLVTLVID